MNSITLQNNTLQEPSAISTSPKTTGRTPAATSSTAGTDDRVELSPAAIRETGLTGRIAMNEQAGNLDSDQANQLYGHVNSIHAQIVADKAADGGTLSPVDAQTIQILQNQLSQSVYSDAHNGAPPPSDPQPTRAGSRQSMEAGRIALNLNVGNISGDQAQQLALQVGGIQQQIVTDTQNDGGKLSTADAQAINQLQSQLSQQIYQAGHGGVTPNSSTVKPV